MLLAISTVLECVLLFLLVTRKVSRSVPVFTSAILFYVLRTLCLLSLFSVMNRVHYRTMASIFSSVDIVLQLIVSVEFFRLTLQQRRATMLPRLWVLVLSYLLGGLVALGSAAALPARSPAPADRATVFLGVSFLVLFLYALRGGLRRPEILFLAGLAVVDLSSFLSQAARSIAALHRDLQAYVAWSYLSAAVYLMVLLFWSARLVRGSSGMELAARQAV